MVRDASAYERELKSLLEGDPESIDEYSRTLSPPERAALGRFRRSPFLVVRAAGSFGFDLVALRTEFAFPLEVKSSSSETIRFSAASGYADEQLEAHREAVDRVGLLVLYAYRKIGQRGGDRWRLYAAGNSECSGRARLMRNRLPGIESTKDGNGVLRWSSGMPLVRFLEFVYDLTDRPGSRA